MRFDFYKKALVEPIFISCWTIHGSKMQLVVEVGYEGTITFEDEDFPRYRIRTHLMQPTKSFVDVYERAICTTRSTPEDGRNWKFETEFNTAIFTTYLANAWIGGLIVDSGENVDLVQRAKLCDIDDSPRVRDALRAGVDTDVQAPVPIISPESTCDYNLFLNDLTNSRESAIARSLINRRPRFLYTQDRIVTNCEYQAFFGSGRTKLVPIKMGSVADQLRETAYAMEHGFEFQYAWTNALGKIGEIRDNESVGRQLAELRSQFDQVAERDTREWADGAHIQTATPEDTRKKAALLRAMAPLCEKVTIFDSLRE